MKKSIEDKILEELIDKVIDKDRDINERYETEALKNATLEVLTEMTNLSEEEIQAMENEIRKNLSKKSKRRKVFYILSSLVFVSLFLLILIILSRERYENELVFVEDFNDNSNGWKLYNDYLYNKYLEDGKYIFSTGEAGQCFEHNLDLEFPKQFTAEITTNLIKENKETYGIKLSTPNNMTCTFDLHPDNKTFFDLYSRSEKKKWVSFPVLTGNGKNSVVQKIIVDPYEPRSSIHHYKKGVIRYYVNNKLIEEGGWSKYAQNYKNLSLYVCGIQTVSFDHIKITDNSTGEVVIDNPFSKFKDMLEIGNRYHVLSSIENGFYHFKTGNNENSVITKIFYELNGKTKIKLKSRLTEGENSSYGLILKADDNNYYSFELKPNGNACFKKNMTGKNELITDHIKTGLKNIKDKDVVQTIFLNGNEIELFINDKLVLKEKHTIKELNYIGFKLRGKQSVVFDKLEVWD